MSQSTANYDGDSGTIPSLEIGSFVAASPDNSEFIGSSSGVFFANTVFRAFAKSAPNASASCLDGANVPDSGSILSCLGSSDGSQEQAVAPIVLDTEPTNEAIGGSSTRSYGIQVPGLGIAPPPAVAKKLLMLYFQHWHPLFPVLHGPAFVDEVNNFYQDDENPDPDGTSKGGLRKKICRVVTFQCVFNIVAFTSSGQVLDPAYKIQSLSALMALLGIISSSTDIPSLQALLVAEIFLVVNMSLRKASTINGTVTRIIYHAGLHRCPSRYVALSQETSDMRKRIFWSAYVLDRTISQLLGHPSALQDSHVDVCIPGLAELHKPVQPRNRSNESATALEDQWWNGLPLAFQDASEHDSSCAETSYVAFFTMLYNYLIILVNRPFLSLPSQRPDFQSSLQTALSASCGIIQKLKGQKDDPFHVAWPGTLPAMGLQDASNAQYQQRGTKRRFHDEMGDRQVDQFQFININAQMGVGALPFPVLEYNGPDFGFDATQVSSVGAPHNLASNLNADAGGFFGNVSWDAFIQGLGVDGRFNM
ncbi:hypothetical protein DL766_001545 [Monosporascus sp. MC13-8B]|uniref:Xylanolytic transcriptional activator regulatory domain-containing protein n=1 Tax=Monosporascus cannonballus TaxID=155416 RepID=A0ABY0GY65_9PEZI|nr:hypothetical protein DL762_007813 [Monosporascus cannonballus]RYO90755.1 hypothetical protein DL763_005224 [Monosporascus cannonballus]RYP37394.1 hypothetical protein DL766_001545 [Monosporascus sp. MC13-8B]